MSMALGTDAVYQQLTILLVLATLSHLTIKRFHQPTIVGEIALGILIGPSVLGFVTAYLLVPSNAVGTNGTQFTMAIFMGATLTATSTAIAASVLLDLGLMKEPVAQTIMGAAVVDDILSLVVLSLVVGASRGEVDPLSIGLL